MAKKDKIAEAKEYFGQAKDKYSEFFERVSEDFRFRAGEQWPEAVRNARENDPEGARPCLVMDKTNQYIRQVVNDARQNRPAIRVRPVDSGADKETAEILQGVIRHIEDVSRADIAYETALDSAVTCGLGWFRITTEVVDDSTNSQEIRIDRIPNVMAVYPDCDWSDPDGADIRRLFIVEPIPRKEFERKYPKAKPSDWDDMTGDWVSEDSVLVAEYYYVEETETAVFALPDGTEMSERQYWDIYAADEFRPVPEVRQIKDRIVKWCKLTAGEILDETTIPCKWIPVVPVIGNEMWVDGKRQLSGMIRWVMDAQRAYNYGRSAFIESVALAPKSPFIAAAGQVEDYQDEWTQANTRNLSVLRYTPIDVGGGQVPPPQRQMPPQPSSGWLQEMQLAQNDIQAALGMYNASLGAPSNEKSGRAIMARQREGDISTYHYIDNLARAMRHAGKIIIDMIPRIYDTNRIIRILGENGEPTMVSLNPRLPQASAQARDNNGKIQRIFNPTIGHYDVSVYVGPAYTTKRQEAADAMVEMTRGNPELMALIGDLMIESMDWPMADRISKRLKALLPDEIKQVEQQEDDVEARIQQAVAQVSQQFQEQAQQFQQQAMEAIQQLQQENEALKADKSIDMFKAQVDAEKAAQDGRKVNIQEYEAETERMQVLSQSMTPEQIQAIVLQTLQDLLGQNQQFIDNSDTPVV